MPLHVSPIFGTKRHNANGGRGRGTQAPHTPTNKRGHTHGSSNKHKHCIGSRWYNGGSTVRRYRFVRFFDCYGSKSLAHTHHTPLPQGRGFFVPKIGGNGTYIALEIKNTPPPPPYPMARYKNSTQANCGSKPSTPSWNKKGANTRDQINRLLQ